MKLALGRLHVGAAGAASELLKASDFDRPDEAACVACWWLHCPGQSIAWEHYVLSVVHLRDLPGVPPAVIRLPHATHEVHLAALDPKNADPYDTDTWVRLQPYNLIDQVQVPSDDDASELAHLCAREVAEGRLWAEPPLSGQVEPWRTVLIRTSAHMRGEPHAH